MSTAASTHGHVDAVRLTSTPFGWAFVAMGIGAIALALFFPRLAAPLASVPMVIAIWKWPRVALGIGAIVSGLLRPSLDAFTAVDVGGVNPASAFGLLVLVGGLTLVARRAWNGEPLWPDRLFGAFNLTLLGLFFFLAAIGTLHYSSVGFSTGAREVVRLTSAMLGGMLIVWWAMESNRRSTELVAILIVGSVVPICVALHQLVTGTGDKSDSFFNRLYGTFTHSQSFGAYLIPLLMIGMAGCISKRGPMRVLAMGWTALSLALVVLTYSRTALLVLAAALVVFVLPSRSVSSKEVVRLLVGVALPVSIGWWLFGDSIAERFSQIAIDPRAVQEALISGSQNSFQWRIVNWAILIRLGQAHSLLGHGLGMTMVLNPLVSPNSNLPYNAHDDFVRFFFEGGVLGLSVYVVHLVLLGLWLWRQRLALTGDAQVLGRATVASLAALFILSLGTTEMVENTAVIYESFVLFAILVTLRPRPPGP